MPKNTPQAKRVHGPASTFDPDDHYEAGAAREGELRKDDAKYHEQRARYGERDRTGKAKSGA